MLANDVASFEQPGPDIIQTVQNAASDQGQDCLFTERSMQNTIKMINEPIKLQWTHPNGKK